MTLLACAILGHRFGIDVQLVDHVMPVPRLHPLAAAPPWVSGVLRIRDRLVPVIDLCQLHAGRRARTAFDTRVVVVKYAVDRLLGLIAERVTDIVEIDATRLEPQGVETPGAPWLGPLGPAGDDGTLIQVLRLDQLLPDDVRELLFRPEGAGEPS